MPINGSTALADRAESNRPAAPLELAVIIPTFNERENVLCLVSKLEESLINIQHEIIFVDDDSPDGTAELIRNLALTNPKIRVLQRISRRGLGSACVEGMLATAAPYIAVMDADLQHDERILPAMLSKLQAERLDVVVATRNAFGGNMGEFSKDRIALSNMGLRFSRWISHSEISDPMSGFFVITRSYLHEVVYSLSGIGFKILLDLISSAQRPVRIGEIPYSFRKRLHGDSKLDIMVGLEFLQLLLDKRIGDLVPIRFLIFSAVGGCGVLLSVVMLYVLVGLFNVGFMIAQVVTTFIAMTGNFFLNNMLTYRDRRLKGVRRILTGLVTFYIACSVGALINIRIASSAQQGGFPWYMAGAFGLAVGAVWNYGISSFTTWRVGRLRLGVRPPSSW